LRAANPVSSLYKMLTPSRPSLHLCRSNPTCCPRGLHPLWCRPLFFARACPADAPVPLVPPFLPPPTRPSLFVKKAQICPSPVPTFRPPDAPSRPPDALHRRYTATDLYATAAPSYTPFPRPYTAGLHTLAAPAYSHFQSSGVSRFNPQYGSIGNGNNIYPTSFLSTVLLNLSSHL
jgi:hypothetical protein